jgi:ketosteroid isomerase-like protein
MAPSLESASVQLTRSPNLPLAIPEQALAAFVLTVRRRDRDAAAACFARDGCFITPDATLIQGRNEIRRILGQICTLGIGFDVEAQAAPLVAGDTALTSERWAVRTDSGAGVPLIQTFGSKTVLRRVEGEWKLLFVAPWGWRE